MPFFLKYPKADKPSPILLVHAIKGRPSFRYYIGKSIHPKNWSFELGMPKKIRGMEGVKLNVISTKIIEIQETLDKILVNLDINKKLVTKEYLKEKMDEELKGVKRGLTIPLLIDEFISEKNKTKGQSRAWNLKYKNLRKKIVKYSRFIRKDIYFEDINQSLINSYAGFLRTSENFNDNTLSRHIVFFRSFIKWAKGKYHNGIEFETPAKRYEADNISFTFDELDSLWKKKFDKKHLEQARDLLLIGCYSGQRVKEYINFKKENYQDGVLIKRASKTKKFSYVPIDVVPRLKFLLDKYDWDLPEITPKQLNINIKEVCRLAEIDDSFTKTRYKGNIKEVETFKKYQAVGTHTARRTYITLALQKNMDLKALMDITGIRKLETLMTYNKINIETIKRGAGNAFGQSV